MNKDYGIRLEEFSVVKIYIPIFRERDQIMFKAEDIQTNSDVSAVMKAIMYYSFAGKVGKYIGVYEATFGTEGYIPTDGAQPTHGKIGHSSDVETVVLTTYLPADVPQQEIIPFLNAIAKAHPWEHPMIEFWQKGRCFLWIPSEGDS